MRIRIAVGRTSNGVFRASCPSLPGCTVEAATPETVQERMRRAILAYVCSLNATPPAVIDLVHASEVIPTSIP